uniref:Uncharacterized protein n=1 Tax=viral metagenome TaxID=1070528 RepID=A0A6C0KFY5_9ZZZZ
MAFQDFGISLYLQKQKEYNKLQEASVLTFIRKQRFIQNYNINNHIFNILKTFFGDLEVLNKKGLIHQYNLLKNYIIKKNYIGLILYGKNLKTEDTNNECINVYTSEENQLYYLSVRSICEYLISEYFSYDEIINCCKKTPNINLYYT